MKLVVSAFLNCVLISGRFLTRKASGKNRLQWKFYCLETGLQSNSPLYSWDSITRDFGYGYSLACDWLLSQSSVSFLLFIEDRSPRVYCSLEHL